MPPMIGELDVTVTASEAGDGMFARPGIRLRYRPIRPAAVLEAFDNA
jgi:hypothetical protein